MLDTAIKPDKSQELEVTLKEENPIPDAEGRSVIVKNTATDSEEPKTTSKRLKNCQEGHTSNARACTYCSESTPEPRRSRWRKTKAKPKNSLQKTEKFFCEVCKKQGQKRAYKSQETLSEHMKNLHCEGEDHHKYTCNQCNTPESVSFYSRTKFINHMSSQHSTMVFACQHCPSFFKMKANYKTHLANHNVEQVKAFQCEVCKASFMNRPGFEAHKRRFPGPHVMYACAHCPSTFSKESGIVNHRCKRLMMEEAAQRRAMGSLHDAFTISDLDHTSTDNMVRILLDDVKNPFLLQKYYTLSEAWSGVNWAELMATQGAFWTDFYDRSILRPKAPWDSPKSLSSKPRTEYTCLHTRLISSP